MHHDSVVSHLRAIALLACVASGLVAAESVTVNWGNVTGAVDPRAFGVNGPCLFDPGFATNPNYLTGLNAITQKSGFIRLHGWGMITHSPDNDQYWLNSDGSWNAAKIRTVLATAVGAGFAPTLLINIPSGPGGGADYQDPSAFAAFAASLVQIVNVDNHFGVTHWELPNEREAGFESPGLTATQAANLIRASSRAMKAKDPNIKVGGPATAWVNVDYIANVAAACLPDIDFVSCHTYGGDGGAADSDALIYDRAQAVGRDVAALRTRLTAISGGKYLPIYVDEYNLAWQGCPRIHTNKEAVYDALVMTSVLKGGGDATMYWHDVGSSMGLMDTNLNRYVTANVPGTFNAHFQGSQIQATSSNDSVVATFATKGIASRALCLINRTGSSQTVGLSSNGYTPETVQLSQLSSSGFSAPNPIAWSTIAGGMSLPNNSVSFLVMEDVVPPIGVIGNGTGLTATYYDNLDFTGKMVRQTDATINFDWGTAAPAAGIAATTSSTRWTGQVQAEFSEACTFFVTGDDGVRLWVNGQLLVDHWQDQAPTEYNGTITLTAGATYDLMLEYYQNSGGAVAKLAWSSTSLAKQMIPQTQLYPSTSDSMPPRTPAAPTVTDNNSTLPTLSGITEGGATVLVFEGTHQLATTTADVQGAWRISLSGLSIGNHVITVTARDSANNGSGVSPDVTVTVASATVLPPAQPAAPEVSDGTTTQPTLSGTTEANALVTIFDNGVQIGQTTADGSGHWTFTTSVLTPGQHQLTVTATSATGGTSVASPPMTLAMANPPPSNPVTPSTSSTADTSTGGCGLGGLSGMGAMLLLGISLHVRRRVGSA